MKPVAGEGDLTVFRGGANRSIRPGDWVTADRDLATNIYAEGGHNGGRQGTLMTASIPAQFLYEIHPGGWVYLPPGTPAATIDRIIRYKGTTMGDMLKRKPGPR